MNKHQRTKLAYEWHRILNTDRKTLFGPAVRLLNNRNYGDRLAQPGFVGPRYQPGGVLFVGMNPGGGPSKGICELDRKQYALLKHLKDAPPAQRVAAFDTLTADQSSIMSQGRLFKNYVLPMLDGTGLDLGSVSYLNILKWRTVPGASLGRLYTLSWQAHTKRQLELLSPRVVIALGASLGNWLAAKLPDVQTIPRIRGDNISKDGKIAVNAMRVILTEFSGSGKK